MIVIKDYGNATISQKAEVYSATCILNGIWQTDTFKQQVLSSCYNGSPGFASTLDTPDQVWANMQEQAITPKAINFYTPSWWQRLKQTFSGYIVDGCENPDGTISVNATAWANMSMSDRAAFIAHECMHASPCNYKHDFEPTAARPFSVPYQIEFIVSKILGG